LGELRFIIALEVCTGHRSGVFHTNGEIQNEYNINVKNTVIYFQLSMCNVQCTIRGQQLCIRRQVL